MDSFKKGPTSIPVDTGDAVSIVCPNLVKSLKPIWFSCSLQTAPGGALKVFGKGDTNLLLSQLVFDYQVLVAGLVDEAVLGVDIMYMFGFVVDFKKPKNQARRNTALYNKFFRKSMDMINQVTITMPPNSEKNHHG